MTAGHRDSLVVVECGGSDDQYGNSNVSRLIAVLSVFIGRH